MPSALQAALRDWRQAIGPAAVVLDEDERARAARATFATPTRAIPAILRPACPDEVAACLRIATAHRVPVYAVSTGKNWGYGSSLPTADGCVLLELRRLDRILEHREDLGIVTIEPGVTFRMLAEHLGERGSRLAVGRTGASPDASVLGHALERGLVSGAGPGPSDRFAAVGSLDIVLADGTRLRPERAGGGAAVHRWGLGPHLDGLFSQSGLGVVVAMTLWLAPRPAHHVSMYVGVGDDRRLGPLMEAIRELMFDGVLADGAIVMNAYNALTRFGQYPWDAADGRTPLPREVLDRLCAGRAHLPGSAAWNAWIPFGGPSAAAVEASKQQCRDRLRDVVDRLAFVDATGRSIEAWDPSVDPARLHAPTTPVAPATDEPRRPDGPGLRVAYWRKRTPMPADPDPDRDGCGVLWCTGVLGLTAPDVTEAASLAADTMLDAGFEPLLTVRVVEPRAVHLVAAIVFDREVPGEDDRAERCHDALTDALLRRGWPPYRLGVTSMAIMAIREDHRRVGGLIKSALDPHGILAPGRYE